MYIDDPRTAHQDVDGPAYYSFFNYSFTVPPRNVSLSGRCSQIPGRRGLLVDTCALRFVGSHDLAKTAASINEVDGVDKGVPFEGELIFQQRETA